MANEKLHVYSPGCGILPKQGILYAPISGMITMLFPTGHAIGITTKEGFEVLLHIGIDAVQLDRQGFQVRKKRGFCRTS